MGGKCCRQDTGGAEFATSQEGILDANDENKERGNWSGRFDFILSCLGYAVGLGNVWRFPYLAYTYGGAVFLIPYCLSLLLIGVPIFFLELSVGQFTSSGPLTVWKMAPAFQGIGAAMLVISAVLGIYYNVIIGWAIYYLIASFTQIHLKRLPWTYCDKEWATAFCSDFISDYNTPLNCSMADGQLTQSGEGGYVPLPNGLCVGLTKNFTSWLQPAANNQTMGPGGVSSFYFNETLHTWTQEAVSDYLTNSTLSSNPIGFWNNTAADENGFKRTSAASEYFNRRVLRLHKSTGMNDLGELHWDLCLCLLAAWVIVFLCLIKGIKSSGKVVYFTALFPYVVLFILMIRGALLEGSLEGVLFYIRGYGSNPPEDLYKFYSEKLSNVEVWQAAATQIFFSLSACYGGLMALASYNRFHTNAFRDTMIIAFGNCLTSFFAGFVIFSFIGALALSLKLPVDQVAGSGIGLAFEVYPKAVTYIPPDFLTPLWSILFFVMLLTLGLDSEFALIETILTSACDVFPALRTKKTPVVLGICILFYLMGLTLCTSGGLYMLNLLDSFGAGWNVLLIAVLEGICVAWVYGHRNSFTRFPDDIKTMIGSDYVCFCIPWDYFRWFWMFMWGIVTPVLCLILMILSLVQYSPIKLGSYEYESGYIALGWLITVLIALCLIGGFILALYQAEWDFFEVYQPTRFWGPALPEHRRLCTHSPDMEIDPWNSEEYYRSSDPSSKSDVALSYKDGREI